MPGHAYFITNVTYLRKRILLDHVDMLMQSFKDIEHRCRYDKIAWVILPDHFHVIIDPLEQDISNILQRVKMSFGSLYRKHVHIKSGRIWQHHFWDHIIRNNDDMNRHIDYIHYNPVKHGYVEKPFDWEYSSIQSFDGCYQPDWGMREQFKYDDGQFGE
ncbi:MAG: transposase [FCB group bacterium]|nr:transposase [FCB group bacterium]